MYVRLLLIATALLVLVTTSAGCGDNLGGTPASPETAIRSRSESVTQSVGPVTVPLVAGWNGVGFQCYSVTSLNATSAIVSCVWYDGTSYQTGLFSTDTLNAGNGTRRGFWVLATSNTSFTYSGTDSVGASVSLRNGWNLVTCPGNATLGATDINCTRNGAAVNLTSVILPQIYEISGLTYTTRDLSGSGRITMGKAYWIYASASNVVLSYGAGSPAPSPSPSPSPSGSPAGSPITSAAVSGQVLAAAGTNLGGVNVTIDGRSTLTNDQGFFSLSDVAPGTGKVASFSKAGYAPTCKTFTALAADTTFFNTTMAAFTPLTVSGSAGGSVTEPGGANLTFPANAIVNSSGSLYTGTVNVSVKTMLPADANFIPCFPGEFTGVQNGTETGLISYGYLTVRLTDASGRLLNLAPGKTANVTVPIDSANDPGNATIPFWYLNESTGKWDYAGLATRSADNRFYLLTVTHFSSINIDQAVSEAAGFTKHVTVVNSDNEPVSGATVYIRQTGLEKTGTTDSNGYCKIFRIKPGSTFTVWAQKGTIKSSVRTETAGGPGTSIENTILLDQPVMGVTTTWGVTPADLDSYLQGPTSSNGTFEVDYGNRGSLTSSPYAFLNTDDQDGYGPEIVTVSRWFPGTYHFILKVYTSGETFPSSGVAVEVNIPGLGVFRRYSPSASGKRVWNVFDVVVDAAGTPRLVDVNTYADLEPAAVLK